MEAVTAQFGTLPLEERLNGSVRAFNQTEIFPEVSGVIIEVLVNNGDQVSAGQTLVRIRDTEARERVTQAEASLQIAQAQVSQSTIRLEQLESQLQRVRQLADRDLQSRQELEQLQSEVMAARATNNLNIAQAAQASSVLEERRNALENFTVRSPIRGVIGQRNAEIGQLVGTGARLFSIGDLTRMKVQISLTESMLSRIREGMRVQIASPSFGDTVITARISRISPFLNPVSHTAEAEIEVPNQSQLLRPGMFVNVDVFYGDSEQATLVPNNALFRHPREGFQGIFVAPSLSQELNFQFEEGQEVPQIVGPTPVEFRRVEIVARGREVTAVRGIDPGTHIVTLGQNLLVDGGANARIRQVEWEHIMNLQQMQSRDLIRFIRERNGSRASNSSDSTEHTESREHAGS